MNNTETINNLIENDDFDKVVSSGLVPVKTLLLNGCYETRWCSTKDLDTTYFEDLDSTQQDLIQQTYPNLDYDTVVENHDNKCDILLQPLKDSKCQEFIRTVKKGELK